MLLSDVCLSVTCIGPKSRTVRPRKTKIATEVAHVTRDSDTTFAIFYGQGHQAALLGLALTREAAAAVSVGTYWAWETTATLHLLGGARRGEERGGDILCHHAHSLFSEETESYLFSFSFTFTNITVSFPVSGKVLCICCDIYVCF